MKKAWVIRVEDIPELIEEAIGDKVVENLDDFNRLSELYFTKRKAKDKVETFVYVDEDNEEIILIDAPDVFANLLLWRLIEDVELRDSFPNIQLDFDEFEEYEEVEIEGDDDTDLDNWEEE